MEKTPYQTKLDFLNSYRWWKEEARVLSERIDNLEDQLDGVRAQKITDMPRGGTPVGFDDLIIKKLDMIKLYKCDLTHAEDTQKVIYECIRSVDSIRDRTILSMNYLDGMSYARIGEVLGYSSRQVKRINKKAVENMQIPQSCLSMSHYVTGTM